jgi:glutathione reductase (NADPH)
VFTEPPLATVGLTEPQASALGPVAIYEADFRPMKSAFHGGQSRAYMKLVVDGRAGRDGRVLGVHMIGDDAPEIIQSIAVALTCGATKRDFDRTLAVHPTVAEEMVLMREPVRRSAAAQEG